MGNEHTPPPAGGARRPPPEDRRRITPAAFTPYGGPPADAGRRPRPHPWRNAPRLTPRRVAGIAALCAATLCLAAAVLFLFLAGAAQIHLEPPESDVSVAGLPVPKVGRRYLLLPGERRLKITAPGYRALRATVFIEDDDTQSFSFTLEKLPGRLRVDTAPVSGAEVLIDNQPRGVAPLLVEELPPGAYQVKIVPPRHLPHEEEVLIEGGGKEQLLRVALRPAWAEIRFASTPPGAEVFIDDESLGHTPLSAEILRGERQAVVRLEGRREWRRTLIVVAGEPQTFEDIVLPPAAATVALHSVPEGASVTVGEEYRGLTPLEFAATPGETAEVRLFKQGYEPASLSVAARSGERRALTARLRAKLAPVSFVIEPADSQLFVNGKLQEKANITLRLPAGRHRVEVRREGYATERRVVVAFADVERQQARIRLQSQAERRRAERRDEITTHAGQTLALLRADVEFTLGASRREPGRRANESLRKIKLSKDFYLGRHEVTNAEFKQFKSDHSAGSILGYSLDDDKRPVALVSWQEAARYCNWLSGKDSLPPFYREQGGEITGVNDAGGVGYRLPTEAEWAWAARARGDGMLKFPWGDKMPVAEKSGNFADASAANIIGRILPDYTDDFTVTAPVGSFAANDKGLFDMGGNVAEWTHDFYEVAPPSNATAVDPLGPKSGEFHVIRGSSWAHGTVTELRLSYRDYGNKPRNDVGFRIARFAE